MSRYIDADKLHDDLTKIRISLMQDGFDIAPMWKALDCVLQQPAADVRENVRGEWKHGDMPTYGGYKCSICGSNALNKSNFCPNCGADMRTN